MTAESPARSAQRSCQRRAKRGALDGLHELTDGKLDWAPEELRSRFPPGNCLRGNPEVFGKLGLPETKNLPSELELRTADELHVPKNRDDRPPFRLRKIIGT